MINPKAFESPITARLALAFKAVALTSDIEIPFKLWKYLDQAIILKLF